MRIFAKCIASLEQLKARAEWAKQGLVQGVEILLTRAADKYKLEELLKAASDLFPAFNVEAPDRMRKNNNQPFDMADQECLTLVQEVADCCLKVRGFNRLVAHMRAYSIVVPRLYQPVFPPVSKNEALDACRKFICSVDPDLKFLAVENTFPIDPLCRKDGSIMVYPCGKVSEDFQGLPRVLDTAHLALTCRSLAATVPDQDIHPEYGVCENSYGSVAVYLGPEGSEERGVAEDVKRVSLDFAVARQFCASLPNIVEVHFNGDLVKNPATNQECMDEQQDGASLQQAEWGGLKLRRLLPFLKIKKDLIVVPEVQEFGPNPDYVTAPNMLSMIHALRGFAKQ